MRTFSVGLTLVLLTVGAVAQQPATKAGQAIKTLASSADVTAMIAKIKSERKDQAMISQPILSLAPFRANMEYRAAVAGASVH